MRAIIHLSISGLIIGGMAFGPSPYLNPTDTTQIFIIDNTGKRWNITHAVNKYGFNAGQFKYGLGPNAIPPIINPEMLTPGDPGYPMVQDGQAVIGAVFNNDVRAYPITVLRHREIVNDEIGNKFVAIGF